MTDRHYLVTPGRDVVSIEQKRQALREVNRSGHRWSFVWEWIKTITIAVVLFLFVRAFFIEAFKIPSGSMERTLLVGDFLLVNKLLYGAQVPFTEYELPAIRQPERGDIIVFQWPKDPSKNFVKRLVGVAGDTLEMRNGTLYRDGDLQAEDYIVRNSPEADPPAEDFRWQRPYLVRAAVASATYHPSRNNWGPLVVPERKYFVLGDNRDNSLDSRYWGFVPDSLVRGRPIVVYYSYMPDTPGSLSWLTEIRWQRVGELIR
ncbi:MAG: signal peptidase I [Gemmatimonadaceae bacterium]